MEENENFWQHNIQKPSVPLQKRIINIYSFNIASLVFSNIKKKFPE